VAQRTAARVALDEAQLAVKTDTDMAAPGVDRRSRLAAGPPDANEAPDPSEALVPPAGHQAMEQVQIGQTHVGLQQRVHHKGAPAGVPDAESASTASQLNCTRMPMASNPE